MSILSTFGIGGLFFILVMVFGSIYYAYKIVKRSDEYDDVKMALFVFMYISIMSVHIITAGQGYNYKELWFVPGIIAGIMSRDQRDKPGTLKVETRSKQLEDKL